MPLNFLCPVHREWVYFHPEDALFYLENAQQHGEDMIAQQRWEDAISLLGCAFESVEILFDLYGSSKSFLITRLTSLSILLAGCFDKQNVPELSQTILKQTSDRLQDSLKSCESNPEKYAYLQRCICALDEHLQIVLHDNVHYGIVAPAVTH